METYMRRILHCTFTLTVLIAVAVFLYTGCDTGNGYKITFDTNRDGDFEIYIMDDDGSNTTRLTNSAEDDIYPSWSWDGSRIAFTSYRDTNPEIYIMNSDGTSQTRLTSNGLYDWMPDWSPDDSQLVFTSGSVMDLDIYKMNDDGTGIVALHNASGLDLYPR